MPLRPFALLLITVAAPAAAKGAPEELRALVERRLKVIDALQGSTPRLCERLVELSHAMPPAAVLSRLAYTRSTGRLELALSQGTLEDARAIVQHLVTNQLCSKPVATLEGSTVTASCVLEDSVQEVLLAAPTAHALQQPGEVAALRRAKEESQTILPDVPALESYEANLQDLAWKGQVRGWSAKIGPAVRGDAVDSFVVTATGSGPASGALELLCSLEASRRAIGVDAFVLEQPRVRNGEWAVDLSMTFTTWRYRPEDEQKEVLASFRVAQQPKAAPGQQRRGFATERSPFGPPGALFAGTSLVLTGKECLKEGSALPPREGEFEGRELDEFAVVFVAAKKPPLCAMIVDSKGECHELRRNTRFGPLGAKVTQIDAQAVTLTRFASSPATDGMPVAVKTALQVRGKTAAPAWFCR